MGCDIDLGVYARLLLELCNIRAACFPFVRRVGTRSSDLRRSLSLRVSFGKEM